MSELEKQARNRVNGSETLSGFANIIFYDWQEGDEHLRWIIDSPESEIAEWAEAVKKDCQMVHID